MDDADHRDPEPQGGQRPGDPAFDNSRTSRGAAHETVDLYRQMVQAVTDYAIFALDATGHVMTWNPGAAHFKGYTADEIIGQHFSVFYPQVDLDAGKPAWELEVASRDGRFEDEGWRIRKDGTRFWANVVITALRGEDGELIGFTKVTRDLTERREAELRALEDARRLAAAEAANRAKAEFLAAMSHELRTPLNAIGGYVDLISLGIRGPVTPQQIEDLKRIRRSQQHLLGIINDLLNFSRMEAGRVTYNVRPAKLQAIFDTVAAMVEPIAVARELSVTWPKDVRLTVYADASKVEQILLNLLTNATKFTGAGGHIAIEAQEHGDRVMIEVRDNGIGIPADSLESIFEPFVQVGRTHTSMHEGTGLGLAISRDLARAMGGDLSVRTELQKGSTFTVELPSRAAPAEEPE